MPSMKAFEEQPELFLRINERQNAFIMASEECHQCFFLLMASSECEEKNR
jgi:hypothetical protein